MLCSKAFLFHRHQTFILNLNDRMMKTERGKNQSWLGADNYHQSKISSDSDNNVPCPTPALAPAPAPKQHTQLRLRFEKRPAPKSRLSSGVGAAQPCAPQYLQTPKPPVDWHPAAASAVTVNGEIYGYPHLLCTILLFTRNAQVAASATVDDLVRNINAAQPQYPYGLAGNLNSSWDTVSLYYDAYRENNFPYDNYYGAADEWSHDALKSLRKIAQLCTLHPNINECVNGYFNDNYDLPAKLFGIRQTQALYGYSERLFHVLKEAVAANYTNNQNTKIAPLPLGEIPNEPLFFTDAFVFRRGMSNDKLEAARNFVQFLATPKMQAAAVGAEETAKNKRLLRYLLPISSKAYDEPPLNTDYFYQTYFRNLTGWNVPNKGLNQRRQKAEPWLAAYLNRPF